MDGSQKLPSACWTQYAGIWCISVILHCWRWAWQGGCATLAALTMRAEQSRPVVAGYPASGGCQRRWRSASQSAAGIEAIFVELQELRFVTAVTRAYPALQRQGAKATVAAWAAAQ